MWLSLLVVLLMAFPGTLVYGAGSTHSSTDAIGLGPRSVQFSTLSTAAGLSQATINAIVQDRQGYMWFGTQEGLNRYDGYQFSVYQHDPENPRSLANDWVWTLFVDSAGTLWTGTDGGGLSRFVRESGDFVHFQHDPDDPGSLSNDRVRVICEDRLGTLWIGTDGGGLERFDPKQGRFVHYRHDPRDPGSLANDKVLVIQEDRTGALWIGTDGGGLSRFDRESGKFVHFRHQPSHPDSLSDDRLRAIFQDRQGRLWIGTYAGGLNLFDPSDGSFRSFRHDPADPTSLSHDEIRGILQDRDGTIWVATDAGLDEWRPDLQGFRRYAHDSTDSSSIANDRVTSIFQDRGGVLWVGTYNGISRWNYISGAFDYYRNVSSDQSPLSNNLVTGISESPGGVVWIGTYGGGLNRLDRASGITVTYRHDPADRGSLSDDRVMTVFADKQGSVWVGTRSGGLNRLNPDTGIFTHYRHDPENRRSLSADGVTRVFGEPDRTLWVGTYGGGLNRLDPSTGELTSFRHDPNDASTLSSDRVLAIYRDAAGTLWIGTEDGGLNRFNEKDRSFTRFRHEPDRASSLGSDTAWEILEGQDGSLWVATRGGGLNRWLPADRKAGRDAFTKYRKPDGMLSNTLYGILEEPSGVLWLSSNRGLTRFNPRGGQVRHFDKWNGLRGDEFNFGARLRSSDGTFFFGGTEGLVAFRPREVRSNPYPPPVAVTAYSRLMPVATGYSQGEEARPPVVTLGFRDYSISFGFSALDYSSPDKNQYRYQLEGFDQEWLDAGRFRRATYTNLPPGSYTFRVKGSNNDGVWSRGDAAITLRVTPAPWKTRWAYAGYVLLVLSIVAAVVRAQVAKLRQAAEHGRELEQQVQLRTRELAERNRELEQLSTRLEEASLTDSLTGLRNRRYLQQHIEPEVAALDRYAAAHHHDDELTPTLDISPGISFMMIDLDGFKQINDTYGHHGGDLALLQVRDILKACCRRSDTIIRWGGDEFLIVGRNASRPGAQRLAERIRVELAAHQYQVGGGNVARLSGSIGIALYPFSSLRRHLMSWEQVSVIADHAAYIAKRNGRNAWVGIYASRANAPEDLHERLKTDLVGLLEQGVVDIKTSLKTGLALSDRAAQGKA